MTGERASAQDQDLFQLNVVFHGLWAFETKDDCILAHTTHEQAHVVVARDGHSDDQYDLGRGQEYQLILEPATGNAVAFNQAHNVVLWGRDLLNTGEKFCTVRLLPATEIRSERRVSASEQAFAGVDGSKLALEEVAMVQIFIYQNVSRAELDGLAEWQREIDAATNAADLHFYAEPRKDHKVDCFHSVQAYKKLAEMFGLEIIPIRALWDLAYDPQPPINGITVTDLWSLHEIAINKGASGSNCDSLVIHNHGRP